MMRIPPSEPGGMAQVSLGFIPVTMLDAGASGSLSVFPDGSAVPADPDLVFHAGKPVTVQVIIPLTGATIDFYNNSGGTIQILADVQGYGVTG
jgi:hypothetical protein